MLYYNPLNKKNKDREYVLLINDSLVRFNNCIIDTIHGVKIYQNRYTRKKLNGFFRELIKVRLPNFSKDYHIETYRFFCLKKGKLEGLEFYINLFNYRYRNNSNHLVRFNHCRLIAKYKNGKRYFFNKERKDEMEGIELEHVIKY